MTPNVHQPSPDEGKNTEAPSPAEIQAPGQAAALRLNQIVSDALRDIPGGEQLDEYFGISGGVPKQPPAEAAESERLIEGLKAVSSGSMDLSSLLGPIAKHNEASEIDPELLRSLMRPPKKTDQ